MFAPRTRDSRSPRSINDDGSLTEASADNIVRNGGSFAVNGSTGGPSTQIGFDASKGVSEELIVSFDEPLTSVSAKISRLFTDEAGSCEQGEWVALRDGVEVASSVFIATRNDTATLDIETDGEPFDQIIFRATEYTGGQNGKTSDSSDYQIDWISFDRMWRTSRITISGDGRGLVGEADAATVVETHRPARSSRPCPLQIPTRATRTRSNLSATRTAGSRSIQTPAW